MRDNDQCRPIVIETLKFLYDLDMEDTKEVTRYLEKCPRIGGSDRSDNNITYLFLKYAVNYKYICCVKATMLSQAPNSPCQTILYTIILCILYN